MNPEEQFERVIEMRRQGEVWNSEDEYDLSARLLAADTLWKIQQVQMPPELRGRVESRVRAHARRLGRQNKILLVWSTLFSRPVPATRPFSTQRGWVTLLAAISLLVILSAGILGASAHSLPGDPLYGVRQAQYQLLLDLTSDPLARARSTISELNSAVSNLRSVVDAGRNQKTVYQAFQIVMNQTRDSKAAVAAVAAGSAQESLQQQLNHVLTTEQQTLSVLLVHVGWPLQVDFTQQLGVLGTVVPWVKGVQIMLQSDGTFLVTITGSNFAPDAKLYINGQRISQVKQVTPTTLVATVTSSTGFGGTITVGVFNPNGTAAQLTVRGRQSDDPAGDDHGQDDHGSTPSSGGGHGKDDNPPASGTPSSGGGHGEGNNPGGDSTPPPGKGNGGNGGSGGGGGGGSHGGGDG